MRFALFFVPVACDLDGILTEKWSEAWLEVPLVGPTATRLLERIRLEICRPGFGRSSSAIENWDTYYVKITYI